MNTILFDDKNREHLLPLTFTRPVCDLRIGILKIKEKWEKYLNVSISCITEDYLSEKFPCIIEDENLLINAGLLPNKEIITAIKNLKSGEAIFQDKILIAGVASKHSLSIHKPEEITYENIIQFENKISKITYPWDIFTLNGQEIEADFKLITQGRVSQEIPKGNNYLEPERIFIEEGAKITFATLNPAGSYIYIGKNAQIMEGSLVHGGLAMCENSMLKLGTKIYGPTTLGPDSRLGGEVNNSVIQGFSNKGHDGFLGNSVLGEWCNIGADSNNSNLKNNYEEVKVWNYRKDGFIKTGLQFCGLIMGDHSKCGINTMFNTGTVVGVSANIFGSGFPRNFVPSFSWGGASGLSEYALKKIFETCEKVMIRRNIEFNDTEKKILEKVFEITAKYRKFLA